MNSRGPFENGAIRPAFSSKIINLEIFSSSLLSLSFFFFYQRMYNNRDRLKGTRVVISLLLSSNPRKLLFQIYDAEPRGSSGRNLCPKRSSSPKFPNVRNPRYPLNDRVSAVVIAGEKSVTP